MTRSVLPLLAALVLVGCAAPQKTVPDARPAVEGSAPGPAYGKPATGTWQWSPAMATAHGHLVSRLKGTGVLVARSNDNRLWITLPGDTSFDANRAALKPAARAALDQVVVIMRPVPDLDVRIVGHTDGKGAVSANNALSLERAQSTRDWLVARGFPPVRLAVAGRGSADPVGPNDTDAGRASNRRVEILVGQRAGVTPPPAP